jgi:aerobic carbon-monoxide dehydrogenase medium subunit
MLVGLRSRKHIPPFELVRPTSIEEACEALSGAACSALMAGGIDLIDRLKNGEAIDRVVHLAGIRELHGIHRDADAVTVGALTTHAEVAGSSTLAGLLPGLAEIWRGIANPRIRYTGTVGGNLMSGMAHYDAPPALMALGASAVAADRLGSISTVDISGLGGRNDIILQGIRIPVAPFRRRLFAERSLHPTISLYLGAEIEDGTIRSARIAVGCAYPRSLVADPPLAGMQVAALGADAAAVARAVTQTLPEPMSDGLASGSYRRRMIEVLTRRLLIKLGSQP